MIRAEVHIPLPKDAIDLIETAREQGKPILGLDAFIVTETATEPLIGSRHPLLRCIAVD
jgi:hypothetical protein